MHNRLIVILGAIALSLSVGSAIDIHRAPCAIEVQATENSTLADYYGGSFDWGAKGSGLKTALFDKISPHKQGSYDGLWTIYKTSDVDSEGKIWDIYSNYRWTPVTDQCGTYSVEGDCYNREHTIPQSVFSKASPMVCDAHHIFPTDGKVNGMRSNYPHGFVSDATYTSGNGSKLGSGDSAYGYTNTCFEPVDDYKGDVARAYFYFVTCYQDKIGGYSYDAFSGNPYPSLAPWAIKTYLKWAYDDPVSQKEIDRNDAIFAIQANRNPYVDHPEAAARVWDPDNAYGYFDVYGSNEAKPTISMPSALSIEVGATQSAVASLSNMTGAVSYSSSDVSVATVDGSGIVTGVGAGAATITGSIAYEGALYVDTTAVTVTEPVPRVTLGQSALSLLVGGDSGVVSFATANFCGSVTVSASSSQTGVATVSKGPDCITVVPVGVGSALITVSAVCGNQSAAATLEVTVSDGASFATITASTANIPTAYATNEERVLSGLSLTLSDVATFDGSTIQFKKSSGCLYNASAFGEPISSIEVSVSRGAAPTITYGSSSALGTTAVSGGGSNSVYTYSLASGARFIKIANVSRAVANFLSIKIVFSVASSQTLDSISITEEPTATAYVKGDRLDLTGLVVTAVFVSGEREAVTGYATNPQNGSVLSAAGTTAIVVSYTFGGVTKTASFDVAVTSGSASAGRYALIESASDLVVGSKVVIAASGHNEAMSTTQNSTNRGQADVAKNDDGTLALPAGVCEFTLESGLVEGTYAFYDGVDSDYIYSASSTGNYLKSEAELDDNASWSISFDNEITEIRSSGSNARNLLEYNPSSAVFSSYSSTSGGVEPVVLYQESEPSNAASWAASFVTVISADCDSLQQAALTPDSGLISDWGAEKSAFESLSVSDQGLIKDPSSPDGDIIAARSLYLYILNKYGTADLANFLSASLSSNASKGLERSPGSDGTVLLAIGLCLAAGVFGFCFLRKKKAI
jgi:endonuclease I